jgi:hypothetical protein
MIPNDIFIAFDLESLRNGKEPNKSTVLLLKALARYKPNKIIVWSDGNGEEAESFGRKYHLDDHVWSYWPKLKLEDQDIKIDIAIESKKNSCQCGRNRICITK